MTAGNLVVPVATIAGAPHPLAFSLHPGAWAAVLAMAAGYAVAIRRPRNAVSTRQAGCFLGAVLVLLVAVTWPIADLAAHWLLLALVVQRLLLLLAFPPLFLAGLPRLLIARITRPAAVDALARTCSRPVPAVVIVTVVAVSTLSAPAVSAQASSAVVRGLFDLLLLTAGVVLWLPVLQTAPGIERMSPLGQAGYLVVQSILPSFLSIVWIFARHPLYPAYARHRVLGLSPLLDQQLSGFAAKLLTIAVLWAVAFAVVVRSERRSEAGQDPEPLTWADVERHLERVTRQEQRQRRHRPNGRRRRSAVPFPPRRGPPPRRRGDGSGGGPDPEKGPGALGEA